MQYVAFCVWLLLLNIFKVHPFCSRNQYLLFVMNSNKQYFKYIYNMFIHELLDMWIVSAFLAIMKNAAVNINVQVFVWTCSFNFLTYISRSRIAGSYGDSV